MDLSCGGQLRLRRHVAAMAQPMVIGVGPRGLDWASG